MQSPLNSVRDERLDSIDQSPISDSIYVNSFQAACSKLMDTWTLGCVSFLLHHLASGYRQLLVNSNWFLPFIFALFLV